MVFSSLFFLYIFLPLNLVIYRFQKTMKAKNTVMLIFSLIFYAWGEPIGVFLLVGMAAADWFLAMLIEESGKKSWLAKFGLFVTCVVNLGVIGVFKYGNFISYNVIKLFGMDAEVAKIAMPIGISFYTFQLLSYVVDVYRGDVKAQRSFKSLLMYVSLFHQCIAGPIVRYSDVNEEILHRRDSISDMSEGIMRFTTGLAKKTLLANACGAIADTLMVADGIAPAEAIEIIKTKPAIAIWVGALAYMFQIYLDFSAYSDMAIGMGRMIGFHYLENFNYPYIANSVTDFWRRWHISLSSFFRDYVYIPLGGNRCSVARNIFNLFVVWSLTGLWHGASWNFILWGIYYFVFLILEKFFFKDFLKSLPGVASHAITLVIVYFGWILFKFTDMGVMGYALKGMLGLNGNGFTNFEINATIKSKLVILILSAIGCTPVAANIGKKIRKRFEKNSVAQLVYSIGMIALPVIFLFLSTMSLVGESYNPFLYWKF